MALECLQIYRFDITKGNSLNADANLLFSYFI